MRSVFPGFPAEGLAFFSSLQRNNRREWFQPRKAIFEERLKQPMRELVGAVNSAMKSFAPDYMTDPDKAIYRIYRDTRFSKDKTPYKDHIAASFGRRGDEGQRGVLFRGFAQGGGDWRGHLHARTGNAAGDPAAPGGTSRGIPQDRRGRARFAGFSPRCRANS